MSRIDNLLAQYKALIESPWQAGLSAKERVIFLVYDKMQELAVTERTAEFELLTSGGGHGWRSVDLTTMFSTWMAERENREAYYRKPSRLVGALELEFGEYVTQMVNEIGSGTGPDDVLALTGTVGLFGFMRLSDLVQAVAPQVKGRLLVFFPGEYENKQYRFLDARDGWNYLAIPLTGRGSL